MPQTQTTIDLQTLKTNSISPYINIINFKTLNYNHKTKPKSVFGNDEKNIRGMEIAFPFPLRQNGWRVGCRCVRAVIL